MLMMNDLGPMAAGVLPFDTMCGGLYEHQQQPPKPRFVFKMPRVVPDQKGKFESDELFRRLSRESDIRYTGYRDRPHEERQSRFQIGCREGHVDIAFTSTGTNLQLMFTPNLPIASYHQPANGTCDFEKERGMIENRMLQEQVERYNDRIRDYQGKPRAYRNQERGVNDSNLDVKRRLNY
ncbi:protein big brother-like isoform X2 [Sipha flava]|uniref:Protein big brother-like isoform X2 n=1 Tax=Sipha flava TaxID=143950 RepID=A0A8B8FR74_9HEMI|nr:protein big brother-like isoform X2 [Sipha flava]